MTSEILTPRQCARSSLPAPGGALVADRLMRLHPAITRCAHTAGDQLFAEDEAIDRLYVVARGWALKSKWLIDGRRQIVDFALPGDVLGSVGARRMSHGVEMLTWGEVILVPRGLFEVVARANPDMALEVCRQREAAEQRAHERIAVLGCRSARLRVCRLLVELAERQLGAEEGRGELRLPLPLRQIHIADALGLRIETVCRVLGQLCRANIASLKGGWLRIADLGALRAEADHVERSPAESVLPWGPRGAGRSGTAASAPSGAARGGGAGADAARRGVHLGEKGLGQP